MSFMVIYLLYALNVLLLLSNFLLFRLQSNERRFSLSMVQALLSLPILIGLYTYLGFNLKTQIVPLLFLSENVFALTCLATEISSSITRSLFFFHALDRIRHFKGSEKVSTLCETAFRQDLQDYQDFFDFEWLYPVHSVDPVRKINMLGTIPMASFHR